MSSGLGDGLGLSLPQNSYSIYDVFYLGLGECIMDLGDESEENSLHSSSDFIAIWISRMQLCSRYYPTYYTWQHN